MALIHLTLYNLPIISAGSTSFVVNSNSCERSIMFAPKTHHPLFLSYGRKWPEGLNVSEKWNVQLPCWLSCISKNPILRTIVTSVVLDHGGKPLPKLVFFWHWICCRLKTPENDDFCKQVAGCINHFWRFTVWLNTAKVARTQSS